MSFPYRVVVFARNEEQRIEAALRSIQKASPARSDLKVYVLINGCRDRTVKVVQHFALKNPEVQGIELPIADKCNAWNTYVYELADDTPCHFFMDGDTECNLGALEKMQRLLLANNAAQAIAGYPMSGRNRDYYRGFVNEHHWVFGNLYAVKGAHLATIRRCGIRLPIGLCGNDHFITKILAARSFKPEDLDRGGKIIFDPTAGYVFRSLQPYRLADWMTYWRRRVTYCLRQLQIPILDDLPLIDLPRTMDDANRQILKSLRKTKVAFGNLVIRAVRNKLMKMYPEEDSSYFDRLLPQSSRFQFGKPTRSSSGPSPVTQTLPASS